MPTCLPIRLLKSTLFVVVYTVLAGWTFAGSFDERLFPAFPGAEGAGAYTRGGRGGQVLAVTTLEDYDPKGGKPIPGSLRAAVKTRGPRTIVFRVGGTIELKADLDITEPFITIAGQSAPGGGICLKNASLKIQAPQVIIRHLRVRPGDVQGRELDAISCREQNVILDHCSASWGIDETISTNGSSANVTVGWCLITESLNNSVHHKGSHGYGSLISGPGEITYHHNVYAYHRSRSPRGGDVLLDFRNNVIAGWGDRAGYSGPERLQMNYVGNYLLPGEYSKQKDLAFSPGGLRQRYFLEGNVFDGYPQGTADNWLLIKPVGGSTFEKTASALRANQPLPTNTVTTESAGDAFHSIVQYCGAVLPQRDAVDSRVLEQIKLKFGRMINSQTDVGGWPELGAGTAPPDADGDCLPDTWETRYGLDPRTANGNVTDTDRDGYTDIEEYLNSTDPTKAESWIDPPAVSSSAGDAFVGATTVSIASATPGVDIFYTLDESQPTRKSLHYTGPFTLDRPAMIRATAFSDDRTSHVRNARLLNLTMHEAIKVERATPGLRYRYYERLDGEPVKGESRLTDDLAAVEAATPIATGAGAALDLSPRSREDQFGFHYTGFLSVPADGIYTFTLRCSPRGRLVIGGQEVVESQGSKRERSGKVALTQGLHPLSFTIYYLSLADKTLEIDYEGPGIARQPLSRSMLFSAAE
jgi:pectate lyase